jgi:hypothetical protein
MPSMNGRLDDPVWLLAEWTEEFVDIEGDAKPKPRFLTRAKMLWDDDYFYIAADMEEPHVWATLTEHDSVIFHDNDFEVFIDPDGDAKRYFEFEINALNTTWDLYLPLAYRDGGSADNNWETHAITATHVRGTLNDPSDIDLGWSVEIAFPWECFRENGGMPCPPVPGDVWRVNFSRVEWDLEICMDWMEGMGCMDGAGQWVLGNGPQPLTLDPQAATSPYRKRPNTPEHNWVWSPQGVVDMHQPELWGFVEFQE